MYFWRKKVTVFYWIQSPTLFDICAHTCGHHSSPSRITRLSCGLGLASPALCTSMTQSPDKPPVKTWNTERRQFVKTSTELWRSWYRASLMYPSKYKQRDATLYNNLYCCQCSTCFRRFFRPSSGAPTVYTASGICQACLLLPLVWVSWRLSS